MPRSRVRLTFRHKLLLALIGIIAPVLILTLLIVRREADQQVEHMVTVTMTRATETFTRVERLRQQQLKQLGTRFSGSNRWGAQLQQALEGDTAFLIEQTRYELALAGIGNALVAFTNIEGTPLTAFARQRQYDDASAAIPAGALDRLFAGDTAIFRYHVVADELYSIHPLFVYVTDYPTGVVFIGSPVDRETARSLAEALGAEVCFFVAQRCLASSSANATRAMQTFAASTSSRRIRRADIDGEPFAFVKQAPPGDAASDLAIVMLIPLAAVVGPFETIQDAIQVVGLTMLLIAVLIALALSRSMARPVRALQAATARVAAGDYETVVTVRSRDELGQLAESFNAMTHGLLLKERYRGVLDKVVSRDVADEMLKGEITLGGETREVTTLFADMRGFTSLSQALEPQQVIRLLNEVMELAEAAVVEAGGVVDKYVGDQIMAIFGAPIARGDDALRALRAATRIHSAMELLNEQRRVRREPDIGMGVGVNTGLVVAGNMGSSRRLNYTVLGGAVNLANRLCSEAASGQTLLSDSTLQRVADHVETRPLGTRQVKGFADPVTVHELRAIKKASQASTASAIAGMVLLSLLGVTGANAQQIQPSARLDVNVFAPSDFGAGLIEEPDVFVAGRASAFLDMFAGEQFYALIELRMDRGEAPSDHGVDARVEQAFLRFSPSSRAHIQAGRFVSPFGNYPQRHHSDADPFIRPPLSYDYRTVASTTHIPAANDGIFNWKNDPATFRHIGSPAVWDAPYQLGFMAFGNIGNMSVRVASMNSAPSSEPEVWRFDSDQIDRLSFVAHAAWQIVPELRVGASYSRGPFLADDMAALLPAGSRLADFHQQLLGAEATFTRGRYEVRAELIHDTWEIPRVTDDAVDISYYVESKAKLAAGAYVAARFGRMTFNELTRSTGVREVWDYDTARWQVAAGYRFTQSIDVRAEYMMNRTDGPLDPDDDLFAAQVSWLLGR